MSEPTPPTTPPAPPAPAAAKTVKVRLLVDTPLGAINTVAKVDADVAKQLEAEGHADSSKAAVAYAESLVKAEAAE